MKSSIQLIQDGQAIPCNPEAQVVFTFANGARVEVSRIDNPALGQSLLISAPIEEACGADHPPLVYSPRISPGATNLLTIEPVLLSSGADCAEPAC